MVFLNDWKISTELNQYNSSTHSRFWHCYWDNVAAVTLKLLPPAGTAYISCIWRTLTLYMSTAHGTFTACKHITPYKCVKDIAQAPLYKADHVWKPPYYASKSFVHLQNKSIITILTFDLKLLQITTDCSPKLTYINTWHTSVTYSMSKYMCAWR